jgi:hypothetical protein
VSRRFLFGSDPYLIENSNERAIGDNVADRREPHDSFQCAVTLAACSEVSASSRMPRAFILRCR